jgi:hypothetical protein
MAGLLGVLAAGAAQGYGAAKNREVEEHNQLAVENMREMLRQEYEERRFNRQLEGNRQLAQEKAAHKLLEHQVKREAKTEDDETAHKRTLERDKFLTDSKIHQLGLLEGGRNSRTAASNAARLKAAEMRASSGGSSGTDLSPKEMIKQIEANNKRIFDLKKEINVTFGSQNNPKAELYHSEIRRLEADNARKQGALGIETAQPTQQQGQSVMQITRNPKTGALEFIK